MSAMFKKVFKPCVLDNGVVLKNRIMYSNGQQSLMAGPESGPNQGMMDDLAIFARSGAALMNWGHFGSMGGGAVPRFMPEIDKKAIRARGERVVPDMKHEQFGAAACYDYSDMRTWNYIGQVAEGAHLYDTKVVVKLGAAFPKGKCLNGMEESDEALIFPVPKDDYRLTSEFMIGPFSPSQDKKVPTIEDLKVKIATKEEIKDAIEDIADMCQRYKNAGFDGMSLRGDRWGLNASTNIRDDEYNGEIEARGLFQYETYKRIKEMCGPEFIVEVVMPGASDHGHDGQLPHGYTEEEFIRFIMMCEDVIDIVEIREETGVGYQCLGYNSQLNVHRTLDYAKHLREAGFKKTIAVNGGYNDPEEMEQIIAEGVVDMISTARSFRAEPNFIDKLHTNGQEVPTPCLRCNKCHGTYDAVHGCSVNPKNALNHRLPAIVRPEPFRSKKVAIIGGGLIGMRTACFAAERGHKVTIFEKADRLGGKAGFYAPKYPDLWPVNRYLNWTIDELGRRGVTDIRLNCEPTPEQITAEGFEAVVACTGSREKCPPINGAESAWKNEDVYYGNVVPGNKVVIVGGGDVSTETAMYLASQGKDVTVLTRAKVLMRKQMRAHGPHMCNIVYYPELGYGGFGACYGKYDNLKPIFQATTTLVTPNSVTYTKDGKEYTLEADTVIVSGGYKECIDDAIKYSECTDEFYLAGDVRIDCDCLMLGNRSAYGRAITL